MRSTASATRCEPEAWERIAAAERVLAVGTTTVRVLETVARTGALRRAHDAVRHAGLRVPPRRRLLTNFHLPRSTLLALVMAFAGVEETRRALPPRDRGALPLLLVRRRDADPVTAAASSTASSGRDRRTFGTVRVPAASVSPLRSKREEARGGPSGRPHFRAAGDPPSGRSARERLRPSRHATAPRAPGVLTTAHGEIPTPAFMPVGTKATVKTLHPDEVRGLGAQSRARQHVPPSLPPGRRPRRELGGLHAFSGWDGPILTDSGGFQVFSLRDTLLAVDDDGVTFRSRLRRRGGAVHAGARRRDPAQPRLATSRCASTSALPPARRAARARAGRASSRPTGPSGRPTRRARRGQLRFGDRPGRHRRRAPAPLASRSCTSSTFDGNAIGGLAIGE